MTIGIIGAMDEEIDLLLREIKEKQEHVIANSLFVQGKLHGKDVVLLQSGIGKVNAAMATTILHEQFKPTHIINTGSAGGFKDDLNVGDIVISKEVVHHDVDVTAFDYAYGQVPGLPATYKANDTLIELTKTILKNVNIKTEIGVIATGDSFMSDAKRVAFIKQKFPNMLAAEMEAAAIAQVCHQYKTPFVVIRALSDIAGKESSVSFDEFLDIAAKNAALFIMKMLEEM